MPRAKKTFDREDMYRRIMPSATKQEQQEVVKEFGENTEKEILEINNARSTDADGGASGFISGKAIKWIADSEKETVICNITERLVTYRLDMALKKMQCCRCDRCKQDIICIALNNLKPHYVVCSSDELDDRIQNDEQYGLDVTSSILKAIIQIRKSPRHQFASKYRFVDDMLQIKGKRLVMTEKEKSHAGVLYQPGDSELVADRDITIKKLYDYNNIYPLDRAARAVAIGGLLGGVGDNCVIEQPLFCTYGYNTTVGDNFFLNTNCKLMDSGKITIGNNVFIAPNVCIITEEHAMEVEQRLQGLEYTHPVNINDNVWICAGVIVLPGVTIGANSVIGAGSVVTKDIPPNSLAVGNPCKVIRTLK